jgi:ATP adenylyltransferase
MPLVSQQRRHLFTPNKWEYLAGKRPPVACILCGVVAHHPEVTSLEVYRDELFVISGNLYPYNPGHLMIFPRRHIESPTDLTDTEALRLHHLQSHCLAAIAARYPAQGFNIGYNLGPAGGGSIAHLHLHVVPRFAHEQGFIGTLANTQLMVEDPRAMLATFQAWFNEHLGLVNPD